MVPIVGQLPILEDKPTLLISLDVVSPLVQPALGLRRFLLRLLGLCVRHVIAFGIEFLVLLLFRTCPHSRFQDIAFSSRVWSRVWSRVTIWISTECIMVIIDIIECSS